MKACNKRLFYKFFDMYRCSLFHNDTEKATMSKHYMQQIESLNTDISLMSECDLVSSGFDDLFVGLLQEYKETGNVEFISSYVESIPQWVLNVLLPDFFDPSVLSLIISTQKISCLDELADFCDNSKSLIFFGMEEKRQLASHFVRNTAWDNYPCKFPKKHNKLSNLYKKYGILGNFHNHTMYSDGKCSIEELYNLALQNEMSYIGVSDHTKMLNGVNEKELLEQHSHITSIEQPHCKIFKSVECEVLKDGTLDLEENTLSKFDYVIAAIHTHPYLYKMEQENRLLKAIENPHTNILAHPSARFFMKKTPIFVDMHKIIDACVANKVAIEINGDPDRLDLDVKYLDYALNKGAYFTLDSDTHNPTGFYNINNALEIVNNIVPPERCLNTFSQRELRDWFRK